MPLWRIVTVLQCGWLQFHGWRSPRCVICFFLMTCRQKGNRDKRGKQIIEISILVESDWCRNTFAWQLSSCKVQTIPSWSTLQTWRVAMMAHYLQLFLWWSSRKLRESNNWDDDFVAKGCWRSFSTIASPFLWKLWNLLNSCQSPPRFPSPQKKTRKTQHNIFASYFFFLRVGGFAKVEAIQWISTLPYLSEIPSTAR